jgi:hypothetical protein
MARLSEKDKKLIGMLLSPSWLSGLIAVIAGLIICIGVIAVFTASSSPIQRQLVAWQQNQPAEQIKPFIPDPNANKPTLQNSWPLLLVWSVIGLVVYTIAGTIIHSISKAEEMHESLGYVNANREKMIRLTAEHIILRILAAIGLGILISLLIKNVIPYSITAAHASAANVLSPEGALYALLSFSIVVLNLHLITIFLRLSLGRIRLFSEVI